MRRRRRKRCGTSSVDDRRGSCRRLSVKGSSHCLSLGSQNLSLSLSRPRHRSRPRLHSRPRHRPPPRHRPRPRHRNMQPRRRRTQPRPCVRLHEFAWACDVRSRQSAHLAARRNPPTNACAFAARVAVGLPRVAGAAVPPTRPLLPAETASPQPPPPFKPPYAPPWRAAIVSASALHRLRPPSPPRRHLLSHAAATRITLMSMRVATVSSTLIPSPSLRAHLMDTHTRARARHTRFHHM